MLSSHPVGAPHRNIYFEIKASKDNQIRQVVIKKTEVKLEIGCGRNDVMEEQGKICKILLGKSILKNSEANAKQKLFITQ